jgi:hypothetical protein
LVETCEILTIKNEISDLGQAYNSKFLEIFILLPFFNDGKWVFKKIIQWTD